MWKRPPATLEKTRERGRLRPTARRGGARCLTDNRVERHVVRRRATDIRRRGGGRWRSPRVSDSIADQAINATKATRLQLSLDEKRLLIGDPFEYLGRAYMPHAKPYIQETKQWITVPLPVDSIGLTTRTNEKSGQYKKDTLLTFDVESLRFLQQTKFSGGLLGDHGTWASKPVTHTVELSVTSGVLWVGDPLAFVKYIPQLLKARPETPEFTKTDGILIHVGRLMNESRIMITLTYDSASNRLLALDVRVRPPSAIALI